MITLATARTERNGERLFWPLHQRVGELVEQLGQEVGVDARLAAGPDSRQFNNVAIVIDRST